MVSWSHLEKINMLSGSSGFSSLCWRRHLKIIWASGWDPDVFSEENVHDFWMSSSEHPLNLSWLMDGFLIPHDLQISTVMDWVPDFSFWISTQFLEEFLITFLKILTVPERFWKKILTVSWMSSYIFYFFFKRNCRLPGWLPELFFKKILTVSGLVPELFWRRSSQDLDDFLTFFLRRRRFSRFMHDFLAFLEEAPHSLWMSSPSCSWRTTQFLQKKMMINWSIFVPHHRLRFLT